MDLLFPLRQFREHFREAFRALVAESFERLTQSAHVDVAGNRATVAELRKKEREISRLQGWLRFFTTLLVLLFIGVGVGIGVAFVRELEGSVRVLSASGAAAGVVLFVWIFHCRRRRKLAKAQKEREAATLLATAEAQMAALNAAYTWDIAPRLIEQLLPFFHFEPQVSAALQARIVENYGVEDPFAGVEEAIHFIQGGTCFGNPFLYGRVRRQKWVDHVYTGTKVITWSEWSYSKGRRRRVVRVGTVTATLTKPKPEYVATAFLFFAHEAAPQLVFSHEPSELSKADDGFFARRKRARELKRLEHKARNLKDESQYTLMGNRDFELLFHATDRTDEVAFRYLFTPAAQQEMLAILKDGEIGYGDDFTFRKQGCANLIMAQHLIDAQLSTDPNRFADICYDDAKATFIDFQNAYFRHFYCAFLPLLAIPAYRQAPSMAFAQSPEAPTALATWELESLAYAYDEKFLAPQHAATPLILKVQDLGVLEGVRQVMVTAHAFCAIKCMEEVLALGPDGKKHLVPVQWIDYRPIEKTSRLFIAEGEPSDDFRERMLDYPHLTRRGLASYLAS